MLVAGTRLEHYEILSPLGAGGMGEVYRARDTKLGRDVALKVLPEVFAGDPERLSRFQREAQVLASLNHPNIAQIYGVVESDRTRSIVMELVDGETLQMRLKRGPIPVEDALHIAKQVAEALEAAHDRGIVHRDLKPGNIMVTPDGSAKVLDFGLAKAAEPYSGDAGSSQTPTMLTGQTQPNVLLGTAAYMSPEQIRGHSADDRSDVWAFGVVLYEMLTGQAAFTGDTVTDLIAGIMRVEPEWSALPSSVTPALRSIVKGCLEKNRRNRFHAIGDVRIEIERLQSAQASVFAPTRKSRERLAWVLAGLLAVTTIAVLLGAAYFYPTAVTPNAARFFIELPPEASLITVTHAPEPAVSPDGRYIVFVAGAGGRAQLWLRPVDALGARPVAGTEGVTPGPYPFWSADSRFIGYYAGGRLWKVGVAGGPPTMLCEAIPSRTEGRGAAWSRDDIIVFAHNGALHRVNAGGGVSQAIRTPDKSQNLIGFTNPSFLPDGRHFLYVAISSQPDKTELRVGDLDSADDRSLLPGNSQAVYAHPNHLMFIKEGTLMARPFDLKKLAFTGDAVPIAEHIAFENVSGKAAFSVSANGILVYRSRSQTETNELVWLDRKGNRAGAVPVNGVFRSLRLSPDEKRVAVVNQDASNADIWVYDLSRQGAATKITSDPGDDEHPVFSPDGKQIAFTSLRKGVLGIYLTSAAGESVEKMIQELPGTNTTRLEWSPAENLLLYDFVTQDNGSDVWALPMSGEERKPQEVLKRKITDYYAQLSPDGHWLLYTSREAGRDDIYVQRYPSGADKSSVSLNGGHVAFWRNDSKEIVFDSLDGKMMAVDVKLGATFQAGIPHELFAIPGPGATASRWAVSANAERFLMPLSSTANERPVLTVVLNWTADIPKQDHKN